MIKNLPDKIDIKLIIPVIGLLIISMLSIYSATKMPGQHHIFIKHLIWIALGLIIATLIFLIHPRKLFSFSMPFYAISILLLILVLIIGKRVSGSESWISIGKLQFQPSEFAKLATVMALSSFLSKKDTDPKSFKTFLISITIVSTPVTLILLQPDFGTAIVFGAILFGILFIAGIPGFWLLLLISPAVIIISSFFGMIALITSATIIGLIILAIMRKPLFLTLVITMLNLSIGFTNKYIFNEILKPHQQKRIIAFLNPSSDPLGAGYNVIQSKIAIGSGGLLGKGYLKGTQAQLRFIPAQWTDFIFCIPAEEFGFVGAITILMLYVSLMLRILNLSTMVKKKISLLIIIGIFSIWSFHIVINLGMTLGLSPVIGIWLPFLSYGGSAMITNMAMFGILMNLYANRREY
jgi:rod shape determining protein RodA